MSERGIYLDRFPLGHVLKSARVWLNPSPRGIARVAEFNSSDFEVDRIVPRTHLRLLREGFWSLNCDMRKTHRNEQRR